MDSGNQQRILGYFIEEAKEHLDTIQKGLLSLPSVVKEPDTLNEMFRAAHSIKGGAAMLGFSSIQKIAHRLEDSFKMLTEQEIEVDQKLESLFLQGYDTLEDLIQQLQGPFGLREEDAQQRVQAAEPCFAQLQSYLKRLVSGGRSPVAPPAPTPSANPGKAQLKLAPNFAPQVVDILRQMLQLFKQQDTPKSRQKLQHLCKRLAQLGAGIQSWKLLVQASYKAIANTNNSYPTIAPVVIKELKQGSDLLQKGQNNALSLQKAVASLTLSPELRKLATVAPASATKATSIPVQQITIPLEPKATAKLLIQAFDKQQLSQLVKLLAKAIRTSS